MMKEKDEPHGVMKTVAAVANCRCVGKDMTVTVVNSQKPKQKL